MSNDRGAAVRKCRDLEQRCLRIGHSVGANWAQGWANDLLDTRIPASLYSTWIAQLEGFVSRREAVLAEQVAA